MTLQVLYTVEVKKHKRITMKVYRRNRNPGNDQTVRQTHREPGENASCVTQEGSNSPSRPEEPWRVIKLQFIDKVLDISVNMRRSVRTVQKTVEGAQVQHSDKFVDVLVAVHRKTAQVLPMRTVQKDEEESYSIL